MSRYIYLHGNGTIHWSFAFAPWLKNELEAAGHETLFETLPDSIAARKKFWFRYLDEVAKVRPDDSIVGWSSGAVAGMRYAQTHRLDQLILVGPHYTDLDDPHEKESGYFDEDWQWDAIKSNVDRIVLLHSDNDSYIPREDFLYIGEKLGAIRREVKGAGHFENRETIPELLELLNIGKFGAKNAR